ncbi:MULTISPECIES: hypothetical protein [Pseudonocardia]|uniref:Uncharacterized protein n=2 Tax=Pseudonocardia TaxID=1847 RepID=A0A1Y2MLZ9_PSEAH|nr:MULTISPECIES: hypothetical protein [Pseudonocardia]OSY35488.1 hypothetical protein BG845_06026 [Pseudonocardia autotrophica]BBG00968.1 hypothetical protein Pdca_21770 [Pseudonocardia autotrophica]GEC29155.1 hypothetical protein PSA01_61840 [Pseudonocardia saturnea]
MPPAGLIGRRRRDRSAATAATPATTTSAGTPSASATPSRAASPAWWPIVVRVVAQVVADTDWTTVNRPAGVAAAQPAVRGTTIRP